MAYPLEVAEDIVDLVEGEVLVSELNRLVYSSDASCHQIRPLCIVVPKHKRDVQQVVEYSQKTGIPVTARGAGTGFSGGALGAGIVLDFTKYMNSILEIDAAEKNVRVQPGIGIAALNNALASHGLFLPPKPASSQVCTVGGMIGNNACGVYSAKYGCFGGYVESVEVVLADGSAVKTRPVKIQDFKSLPKDERKLYERAYLLLRENQQTIRENTPKVRRNSSGYNLGGLLAQIEKDYLDLTPLFVGSEGTLAAVVEATLKVVAKPKETTPVFAFFQSLERVVECLPHVLNREPLACEVFDYALVDKAAALAGVALDARANTQYILILEFENVADAQELTTTLANRANTVSVGDSAEKKKKMRAVGEKIPSVLLRPDGKKKPTAFIEDVCVEPSKLQEFVGKVQEVLSKKGLKYLSHGAVQDGCLKIWPLMSLGGRRETRVLEDVADEVADIVADLGGTLSAAHGDGFNRTQFLPRVYGPLYDVFSEVKHLFDPDGRLNPDKKTTSESRLLSKYVSREERHRVPTGTVLDQPLLTEDITKCVRCGFCRSICPVFMTLGDEDSLPKAKMALLQEIIGGRLDVGNQKSDLLDETFRLCLGCRLCDIGCPAEANPSNGIKAGLQLARKQRKVKLGEKFLANYGAFAQTGSSLTTMANLLSNSRLGKTMADKLLGLDATLSIAPFGAGSLESRFRKLKPIGHPKKVAYFPGCHANHHAQDSVGAKAVKILEKCGFDVVMPVQRCCGGPKTSLGISSEDAVKENLDSLSSIVDDVQAIVTTCPTCTLMFKKTYPSIVQSDAANSVAEKTAYITEFLVQLAEERVFSPPKRDMKVVYNQGYDFHDRVKKSSTWLYNAKRDFTERQETVYKSYDKYGNVLEQVIDTYVPQPALMPDPDDISTLELYDHKVITN